MRKDTDAPVTTRELIAAAIIYVSIPLVMVGVLWVIVRWVVG